MNDSVQENLLGLLLGALEDEERRKLEDQLETDAELRAQFAELRDRLAPLNEGRVNYEPAAGLADRAFAYVQREAAIREAESTNARESGVASTDAEPTDGPRKKVQLTPIKEPVAKRSWPMADVIAATSIVAVALAMMLPALFASWESSNRLYCEANLKEIGWALHDYAQQMPDQRLPQIPTEGNRSFAGLYAPVLHEAGYITNPGVFLCASSNLAKGDVKWRIPPMTRIDQADKAELIRLQSLGGGSYGYNLGYWENNQCVAPSVNNPDPRYVWAGDTPAWNIAGRISENHAGNGQNLLFADMHTRFVSTPIVGVNGDDAFRSDRGLVEAGVDRRDSVIGDSRSRPVAPKPMPFPAPQAP